MIRAVIFDLDGTLLNRKLAFQTFMSAQADRFESSLPGVSREAYLAAAVRTDQNGTTPRRQAFSEMGRELGLSAERTAELLTDYRAGFPAACTLFPGANEVLAFLRSIGLRLGLITNGSASLQGRKLDALALGPRFDAILISEAEGMQKPDEAIFRLAAERLETPIPACVFVGDNPDADIRGAKASGMRAIWVRDPWWGEEPKEADAVIGEIGALPPIVASWRSCAED